MDRQSLAAGLTRPGKPNQLDEDPLKLAIIVHHLSVMLTPFLLVPPRPDPPHWLPLPFFSEITPSSAGQND